MADRALSGSHRPSGSPKLLWFCALTVAGSLSLSCGGGSGKDGEKTVIQFWQFWTEPRVRAVITQAVTEFELLHPEYKVEVTDLTWDNGYQKIVAAFAAGRPPDLLELGSDWIAQFAAAGALMDLSRECARYRDTLAGWPPCFYGEQCWALPWYLSTRVIYQNDDIARIVRGDADHPIIWRDLMSNAMAATTSKPVMYGYGVNAAERHRLYKAFLPYLWSAGGELLTPDLSECALDSRAGLEAIQLLTTLSTSGLIDKQAALEELFIDGKLLYLMSGDWMYEKLKRSGKTMAYSAFRIPFAAPGVGSQTSFAGGEYLTIPRRGAHRLEALELARHLLAPKHIFNLCIATGNATPAHRDVAINPYFMEDSIRQVFIRQIPQTKWSPSHPRWVEIEEALEWGIEQAIYGRLAAQDALAQTCERINAILAEQRSDL